MDNEPTTQDLISLSFNQKPIDFEDTLNSLLATRVADAIDAKKIEVAQSMFGKEVENEIEDEQVELEEPKED